MLLWQIWLVTKKSVLLFLEIDGEQRAAAFAFYVFFALFPLLLLIISVGSLFIEPHEITDLITDYVESFIPLTHEDSASVFQLITGLTEARRQLGLLAGVGLLWSSTRFFHALVRAVNRAWHTIELDWWKLPLKNFAMVVTLASALLLGILVPAVLNTIERIPHLDPRFMPFFFTLISTLLPSLILFYGIMILYKLSPRRRTQFREVWLPALLTTLSLNALQKALIYYSYNIWNVNALYGTVGVFIILLLWIYLCGVLIIFGGCICSAQNTVFSRSYRP